MTMISFRSDFCRVEKVASLAEMLLKAKEKLSLGSQLELASHTVHLDQEDLSLQNQDHSSSAPQKQKKKSKRVQSQPPLEHAQQKMILPKVPGATSVDSVSAKRSIKQSIPKYKIDENSKKFTEKKQKSKVQKEDRKIESQDDDEDDDGSVVEKYFSMKRAQQSESSEKLQLREVHHDDEDESMSPFQSTEYIPASPMFPLGDDQEAFPFDLPPPTKNKSPSFIDPTPLDLSYFNTDQKNLLDHKSHSIIEEDEEENEEDEDNKGSQASCDRRNNFVIHEDDEEEEEEEEEDHQLNARVNECQGEYEDDFEEGYHNEHSNSLKSLHVNQREESESEADKPFIDHHDDWDGDDASEDASGKESNDDYEKLLNMECENLRRRLEEKILQSQFGGSLQLGRPGDDEDEEEEDEEEEYGDDYEEENEENNSDEV